MTEQEAYEFIDKELRPLWPEWEFPDAAIPIWVHQVKQFDYQLCRKGVRDYYATREGSFKRPKLHGIIRATRPYQEATYPDLKRERTQPKTDVFVKCVKHNNLVKMHQFFPVFVEIKQQDDHDYVVKAAEALRDRSEQLYGGSWIILQYTTRSEMQTQRWEYRRQKDIVIPQ
ncbi:MAG: hypothetical protein ACYST6_02180 [Planctomycetota bacterium]|jgi:hypothetical protein